MRKLIWLIVILAGLYAGYWFVGARLLDGQIAAAVSRERAAGRELSYDVLKVQGFPSRFDIYAENLVWNDPQRGLGWSAPQAQIAALSYQPQHYIAIWPPRQQIRIPGSAIDVAAATMRASLAFATGPSFVLDRIRFDAADLSFDPVGEERLSGASVLRLATDRTDGFAHRIGLEVQDLILPPSLRRAAGPAATDLPAEIGRIHLDAVVDFDARWDRHSFAGIRPQPTAITLADASVTWGPTALTLSGRLDIDRAGVPTGSLQLKLRGWRQLVDLLISAGILPETQRRMIEGSLALLGGGGSSGELALPLDAKGGVLYLGPVPVGPAPNLRFD